MTLENKTRRDWVLISISIENLRKEPMGIIRHYLIKDLQCSIKNYTRAYKLAYDPLNPPGGTIGEVTID